MATNKSIQLRTGRTYIITTRVSGIDDWTDKNAVMYVARNYGGSVIIEKSGTIAIDTNKASFDLSASETRELSGTYKYEITIYKDDGSFVKDVNYGDLAMKPVVNKDPTT